MTTPHQAIYRRWRAQTFAQIVGQQAVVETLRNAIRSGRTVHAYLFVGPRGTGKTSMARILAKALNCTNLRDGEPCDKCPSCVAIREGRALDVDEFDAASNNTVGDMRELLPRVFTTPSDLRRKVFIVDEVQRITAGWDVLLKTLEEPPDHVVFIFCTTDSSQIRPAVLSRVQRFDFRPLTIPEIAGKLATILRADDRKAEPEAIDLIARLAAGGMRDAESMLDQLLATGDGPLTAERVRDVLGLVSSETLDAFVAALVSGDALSGIEILDGLEERGRDLRAFLDQAIERLRVALIAALGRGGADKLAAAGPAALTAAARRLAAIDPIHPGPGGLRLQLELALLAVEGSGSVPLHSQSHGSGSVAPATPTSQKAAPQVEPATAPRSEKQAVQPAALEKPPTPAKPAEAEPPTSKSLAPASGAPPSAAPSSALQTLLERWPEVVEVVSKSPPTKPLILACRPVSVEGSVVTLGFPEAQSFFKDVAERRRSVLEDGVGRVLGFPVSVRCVAANVEVAPLGSDADGTRLLTEFRRIYGDDVVDVPDVE